MTQETALKHIKAAWIAGLISAAVTLLVSVIAAAGVAALADMGFGWWTLLDVALLAGLSFGVYRKSRTAAVLLFTYFLIARIALWVSMGSVRGLPMALLFGYFYAQGIRGTFAYQALIRADPSSAPPAASGRSWKWLWVLGGMASLAGLALLAGLIYIGSVSPDTAVVPAAELPERFVTRIRELSLLEPEEKLVFFYSDALTDIEDGVFLLTDRNVVICRKEDAHPKVIVPISSIRNVEATWSDSFWEDSQVTLTLADDTQVRFPLSSEKGGDKAFFDAWKKSWEAQTQKVTEE